MEEDQGHDANTVNKNPLNSEKKVRILTLVSVSEIKSQNSEKILTLVSEF